MANPIHRAWVGLKVKLVWMRRLKVLLSTYLKKQTSYKLNCLKIIKKTAPFGAVFVYTSLNKTTLYFLQAIRRALYSDLPYSKIARWSFGRHTAHCALHFGQMRSPLHGMLLPKPFGLRPIQQGWWCQMKQTDGTACVLYCSVLSRH